MGLSKRAGGRCAKCGKKLETDVSSLGARRGFDSFADTVRDVSLILATPGYVCKDCGAIVCKGCVPLDGSISCPKCGSENMRLP